jgi:hypothetical protein
LVLFLQENNKILLFLKKKEARRLLCLVLLGVACQTMETALSPPRNAGRAKDFTSLATPQRSAGHLATWGCPIKMSHEAVSNPHFVRCSSIQTW